MAKLEKSVTNRIQINRQVAEVVVGTLQRNLRSGVDADGRKLPKVSPWVRAASKTTGRGQALTNIKPLLSTGQMRASIAPQVLTNDRIEIYGTGAQQDKINRMTHGTPGTMAVSEKGVRGLYSGIRLSKDGSTQYVRINTPVGWRTKRVRNGQMAINPRKRKFLYLSSRNVKTIVGMVDDYVATQTKAANR